MGRRSDGKSIDEEIALQSEIRRELDRVSFTYMYIYMKA